MSQKQTKPPNLSPYLKRLKANKARHGNTRSKRAIDDMGWTGAHGGFGNLEDTLKTLFDERLSISQNMYSIVDNLSLDYTWTGDNEALGLLGKIHEFVSGAGTFPAGPGTEGFAQMAGFSEAGASPNLGGDQQQQQQTPGQTPSGAMGENAQQRLKFTPQERQAYAQYAPNVPAGPAGDTDTNQAGGSQVYMQIQFDQYAKQPKNFIPSINREYVEEIFEHSCQESPNMGWQIAPLKKNDRGEIVFPYWDPRTYGLHNKEGWFFSLGLMVAVTYGHQHTCKMHTKIASHLEYIK